MVERSNERGAVEDVVLVASAVGEDCVEGGMLRGMLSEGTEAEAEGSEDERPWSWSGEEVEVEEAVGRRRRRYKGLLLLLSPSLSWSLSLSERVDWESPLAMFWLSFLFSIVIPILLETNIERSNYSITRITITISYEVEDIRCFFVSHPAEFIGFSRSDDLKSVLNWLPTGYSTM